VTIRQMNDAEDFVQVFACQNGQIFACQEASLPVQGYGCIYISETIFCQMIKSLFSGIEINVET
jgi:hypothetical protein